MDCNAKTIKIDGVDYVRADAASGKRAVVVVDRGWIFAGDVVESEDGGPLVLKRAVWVFRWESIGFDGVLKDPKNSKVTLKKMAQDVEIPLISEIFRVPVDEDWGL
jgi:hypothetical protein